MRTQNCSLRDRYPARAWQVSAMPNTLAKG
jgi:hypothetical protein